MVEPSITGVINKKIDIDMEIEMKSVSNNLNAENNNNYIDSRILISKLYKLIELTPNNYDLHLKLINTLELTDRHDKLEEARINMARIFPLPIELWTKWIEDRKKYANTIEQKMEILELYLRSNKDYIFPSLCISSLKYILSLKNYIPDFLNFFKAKIEEILALISLDCVYAHHVWKIYIEFSIEYEPLKIENLFKRAFYNPILYSSELVELYKSIFNRDLTEELVNSLNKSSAEMKMRESFENRLQEARAKSSFVLGTTNIETLNIYDDYLKFELSNNKSGTRLLYLYERTLVDCFLIPRYWLSYLNYISKTFSKSFQIKFDISKRAVRNCCWEISLWIEHIFAAGQMNVDCNELENIYLSSICNTFSLKDSFELHLSFSIVLRLWSVSGRDVSTHLVNSYKRIFELMESVSDYKISHLEFYNLIFQRFMLYATENLPQSICKSYYEFLVKENRDWSSWKDYINFETRCGNLKAVQSLFKRAKNMAYNEGPFSKTIILNDWLLWEKQNGSWESIQSVNILIFENDAKQQIELLDTEVEAVKKCKKRLADESFNDSKKSKKNPKTRHESTLGNPDELKEPVNTDTSSKLDSNLVVNQGELREVLFDERTAFVLNLPYNITEKNLMDDFSIAGNIIKIRMKTRHDGKSVGFAHITFSTSNEMLKAVEKFNSKLFHGRIIEVKQSQPPPLKVEDSNSQSTTIFIRGLPTVFRQNIEGELSTLFERCGKIISVRVPRTDLNYKGIAYIEFANNAAKDKALKLKDIIVDGNELIIKESNYTSMFTNNTTLDKVSSEKLFDSKPRSMFLPRAAVAKSKPTTKLNLSSTQIPDDTEVVNILNSKPTMTNDDFRAKFLKNK